ncbi:MAG: hypothetical protein DMF80_16760 [Acidobacteria bacterium]|nr:MAG: hypothetical protein DMF80_16760 [Acidobacteriota bacterium]PYQ21268.1 MAG: hypothetical protein DMF81_15955 [Acidobacteriota bacterium]
MGAHVPDARLLEVLEGAGDGDRGHVQACPQCQARLVEARSGLALARAAAVPEPSPLYWDSFPRQVARRLHAEGERRAFWRRVSLGPALAAAVVLVGIVTFLPLTARQPAPLPERPLPAWSALPPAEDDPGLDVLRAVTPTVAEATPPAGCPRVDDCLVALSDEESQALADGLRRQLGGGKVL